MNRSHFEALDSADPLAPIRDLFVLPDAVTYLDGNSLGALPKAVPGRVQQVIESEWAHDLIRSWNLHSWIDLPRRVGDRIGRLVGAEPGAVVCGDTTSVNLYKAVGAAISMADGGRILTDSGNFPTDVYVLKGLGDVTIVEPGDVLGAIREDFDVVALTQVDYRTGRLHDMESITRTAKEAGVLTVWDLAHSAGAFPVGLAERGVDFAVGCGYKYLNGGPGAPAFLYVAPRHHGSFANPIQGWFGHAAPFEFRLDWQPADGIARGSIGTPHVLSMTALDAALDVFDSVDLSEVRIKSEILTESFIELIDQMVPEVEVVTPRERKQRGSQVSVRHPHGYSIMQALIDAGVIGDFRSPDVMRFGFAPLYVQHVDVFDAVATLRAVLDKETWKRAEYQVRAAVT